MSREYHYFIKDIKQCCEKIIRYTELIDFKVFCSNEVIYDAVIRNLEIIGEAAKNIPEHIRASYPKVHWKKYQDYEISLFTLTLLLTTLSYEILSK